MLPVEQIKPFVMSGDPLVSLLAVDCLEDVRWPEPLTGEFLMGAIRSGRPELSRWLGYFVPTAEVLDYAIETARNATADDDSGWPFGVIANSDDALWTAERTEAIRRLRFESEWMDRMIDRRIDLMQWPTERLRERLLELSAEAERLGLAGSEQHEAAAVLARLVSRKDSVEWAREELRKRLGESHWTETWLFRALIRSGDRECLDWALDRLAQLDPDENEALTSALASSLHTICKTEDLPRVEVLWPRVRPGVRSYLVEGLGKFRLPEAEPILLRCARELEEGSFEQTLAASGLCDMLATTEEAREFLRDLTDGQAFDPTVTEMETLAIPLGIITGRPFAEEPQWRERVAESEKRVAERRAFFERQMGKKRYHALLKGLRDSIHEPRTRTASESPDEQIAGLPAAPRFDPSAPIARLAAARTVGRNDPCPCGSGKKYKKCCLGKPD